MDSMDFWGAAVKARTPLKVTPRKGFAIHLSQMSLEEVTEGDGGAVYVKVGEKTIVLGNLSSENVPHMALDLVFKQVFELSHEMEKGNVHFSGYHAYIGHPERNYCDGLISDGFSSDGSLEITWHPKDADSVEGDAKEDKKEIDENEEVTPTPKKKASKKRPNESASKNLVSAKKAKKVTSEKTADGKKGVRTVTPESSGKKKLGLKMPVKMMRFLYPRKDPMSRLQRPMSLQKKAKKATSGKTADGKKGVQATTQDAAKQGGKTPATAGKRNKAKHSGK